MLQTQAKDSLSRGRRQAEDYTEGHFEQKLKLKRIEGPFVENTCAKLHKVD